MKAIHYVLTMAVLVCLYHSAPTLAAVCAAPSFMATRLFAGQFPQSVVVGDFNGDGKADLAVANLALGSVLGSVAVLLSNGDGTFQGGRQLCRRQQSCFRGGRRLQW